ncbi:ABC transporter ATP-binding protein [Plectonema cf. radiosum LEGE 06105]|uniref:ABC transporter ATP-binding protein n=1 Tax=Plectonema cf. radiosum LEGE 06105 TaxID=945769 RepID=A0A8J7JXL1_9CYAN|nr:ABC transporter ATP-binding protein [Plectonema radiosum]MBE9216820.1 ABC transporter ATP-binding protein [Plectonema cf. radiosum LEGE 06105]
MNSNQQPNIWQLLWRMIRYTPRLYLIDAFFWLFIMGLPILPGLIIREFFNTLTGETKYNFSPTILIIFLLATGLGRVIFIFIGRLTKTQHRFTMSALLRHNLLQAILKRPGAMSLPVSQGELISYFRDDIELIEDNVVGTAEIFNAAIFAFTSLIILANINWKMTVLVFLPLVLVIIVIQQIGKRIKRYRRTSRIATVKVTGLIGEIFNSVQAIKVAGAETLLISHFQQLNEQRRKAVLKDQLFTAILNSNFQNLVNLGTGIVLLTAASFLQQGTSNLSVGNFALFVYYLAFVTDFITFLGEFLASSKQAEVSFERMADLIKNHNSALIVAPQPLYLNDIFGQKQQLPQIKTLPQNFSSLQELTIENLTYHYPGTDQGIENISFFLPRGSLTVITGGIGAGKTTLLRTLLGLLPLQSGKIYWNDYLIDDPASFFAPPRSAYTPQIPQLFSQTLQNNLLLGWEATKNDIDKALHTSVFAEDVADMPSGLETLVGYKGVRLSGGQLQRAAITRALIRQPELLVFDDISSALDIETEEKLWSRLLDKQNNSQWQPTILIVSHNQWLRDRANQVIFLDKGRIASF